MPDRFTDPFRYVPHISVQVAAKQIIEFIESQSGLAEELSEGKMMGVLVCRKENTGICFIAAFSGNVGGKNQVDGFVPPIFNLLEPGGYFKTHEAEITQINHRIKELSSSGELDSLRQKLNSATLRRDTSLSEFRERMGASKAKRTHLRNSALTAEEEQKLIRESQFEKAELKRLKIALQADVDTARSDLDDYLSYIAGLKKSRAEMSDSLQDWIFRQYIVHNGYGNEKSIADIFAADGLVPPGGTGECAAPKLLEYAYRNGLQPLAMGEFWYGKPSDTAVRTHGRFYPSCTSKCGPLLGYMLKGLDVEKECTQNIISNKEQHHAGAHHTPPVVIYEDDQIIVAEKPSGMPSVPGLDGRISLEQWLTQQQRTRPDEKHTVSKITAVHRLDMDTSGVLVFAKTPEAESNLKKQFEEHTVRKTYMARLSAKDSCETTEDRHETLNCDRETPKGAIELPLSPDYDERPRQKVDFKQGKHALTEYELVRENPDSTTDVLFHPVTGRTHQLRVHSAHHLGLGRPIVGDLLYGGWSICNNAEGQCSSASQGQATRLHLHAFSISFRHPSTGEDVTYSSRQYLQ